MKNSQHIEKIRELSKSKTMQQAADEIGLTYNQVMYIAGKFKIRFSHKGSRHYMTKLEECDIPLIRQLYREGTKKHIIAKKFDVNVPVIEKILSGANWNHVK